MGSVKEDVKGEKAHTLEAAGGEDFTNGTGVDGEVVLTARESHTALSYALLEPRRGD